ncbi:fatty acid desaturase-domain-containing protein [Mycena sanguinolenta]|nr:fatty acid desaturase-domain-containing protein [Mycena sanguinolenta]
MFEDAPEYLARKNTPFVPPNASPATSPSSSTSHGPSPVHYYPVAQGDPTGTNKKSLAWGLWIGARSVLGVTCFYWLGTTIETVTLAIAASLRLGPTFTILLQLALWATYWFWQSVAFASLWCYAHEAGHGTISDQSWINHSLGYILHTFLFTPYFAWRSTHRAHHALRSELGLRPENAKEGEEYPKQQFDYHEVFEDTPLYVLGKMIIMQILGLQMYFVANTMGSPSYPKGTNHFSPLSPLFKRNECLSIVASDLGLVFMGYLLWSYTAHAGVKTMLTMYFVPYLVVMITFLHHCDPTLPHYRKNEWTPIMGWVGRFFFHNVSHDHVAHHVFSSIPFYNQPLVTEHLKVILKEHYNYDPTPCFRALYRSFTECAFVEDEGDIIFYKNMKGESVRFLATHTE